MIVKIKGNLQQMDFYEQTLEKRFKLLEKRIKRAEDEMFFLRNSYFNNKKAKKFDSFQKQVKQLDLFAV